MELVEREDVLRRLDHSLRGVAGGTGHTFLIGGEAGIGKTSLLATLAALRGEADLWWGACDALQTPHPLAPLHDIARASEVGFRPLLGTDGDRPALFEAVLDELQHARRPTLLVVEDAHWADDATLDLLKFLGRRIDRAPCLLVVSYRDDEVTPTHPLRRLMGELPGSLLSRLELPRLSPAAVEMLARRALRSPAGIHAATQGNPFFVTELLRHGADGVPRGVQDLVLARYARLTPPAQAVVRLACVVPAKIERWLIDRLLAPSVEAIEECLNSGLLTASAAALGFRHELARVAVESSLSVPVAQSLHGMIFRALDGDDTASASLARLVHHATHAGDMDAVLRLAPEAARQAQRRAAHREAVAHYRTALDALDAAAVVDDSIVADSIVADSRRATWLDAYARECQLIDQLDEAIAARLQLGELHRRGNNPLAEAENLSQLALVHVLALHNADADAASLRAIELLERLPPSVQLAGAYRVEAQLRMLNRDCESSIDWSNKAIALAERFDNREILAAGIGTLGSATLFLDYDAGCAHLQRALELALADGSHYIAANTYSNLGSGSGEVFQLRQARHSLLEAIAFAHKHEIDFYRNYAMAWLALCELYLGLWDDAAEHASDIVQQATHRTTSRVMALVALGRVHARRGDPGVDEVLDEALHLALASNTLQRIAPVRAA
ncbi:MAG: AAA family ATPase, partial [Luteimonas sp.]|nr:AAA family ATPase [Luteimonas sp.]